MTSLSISVNGVLLGALGGFQAQENLRKAKLFSGP